MHKKVFLTLLASLSVLSSLQSAVPCGDAINGVLRVGIMDDNLPWSDMNDLGNAVGFDPLLAQAVAQVLGYNSVQFVVYPSGSEASALDDLEAGNLDIFADSSTTLVIPPTDYIGIVTDGSGFNVANPLGWAVNLGCCALARRIELAINQLVANGQYAQILQTLRLNSLTAGATLGFFSASGILLEPIPFASSEAGTIPASCLSIGPVSLPQTNCISAFLQASCSGVGISVTGAVIPS